MSQDLIRQMQTYAPLLATGAQLFTDSGQLTVTDEMRKENQEFYNQIIAKTETSTTNTTLSNDALKSQTVWEFKMAPTSILPGWASILDSSTSSTMTGPCAKCRCESILDNFIPVEEVESITKTYKEAMKIYEQKVQVLEKIITDLERNVRALENTL